MTRTHFRECDLILVIYIIIILYFLRMDGCESLVNKFSPPIQHLNIDPICVVVNVCLGDLSMKLSVPFIIHIPAINIPYATRRNTVTALHCHSFISFSAGIVFRR